MSDARTLDALLQVGEPRAETARWNVTAAAGTSPEAPGGLGMAAMVTFSFMAALPAYEREVDHPGFRAFDAVLQDAARRALAAWEAVCNITFIEVPDTGQGGAIRFGRSDMTVGGLSWFPDFAYDLGQDGRILGIKSSARAGDVWLSTDPLLDAQANGGYGHYALVHEIGHAIGLKHPFEGRATLPAGEDSYAHSVMAYAAPANATVVTVEGTPQAYRWTVANLYPAAPMPEDIAAAQFLYGANKATHAGDTTYAWAPGERFLTTIWDGGGVDAIDAGNQVLPCVIDLQEGAASSIGLRLTEAARRAELPAWATSAPTPTYDGRDNLRIAHGVTIENALGGAGDDLLIGNAAGNILTGGAGQDTLRGGDGWDTAVLPGPMAATVLVQRPDGGWDATGPGGHDLLQQVEALRFEDGVVRLAPTDWVA